MKSAHFPALTVYPFLVALILVAASSSVVPAELDRELSADAAATGNRPIGDRPSVRFELESLPGIVLPSRQVTMSSPLEGMLIELNVEEGQVVSEGEILGRIDHRVAEASVKVARAAAMSEAEIRHAREELKFSEQLLERLLSLRSANAGTDFEVLEARTRVEKARASVDIAINNQCLAQQRLELELARLESHNIRAPFEGQILDVNALPGTTLTRDDDLLTIIQMSQLEVELHLPLDLYRRLKVDESYSLIAGPPLNRRLSGELKFVAPVVDAATRTFRTIFLIQNSDLRTPAGVSVRFDFSGPSSR